MSDQPEAEDTAEPLDVVNFLAALLTDEEAAAIAENGLPHQSIASEAGRRTLIEAAAKRAAGSAR